MFVHSSTQTFIGASTTGLCDEETEVNPSGLSFETRGINAANTSAAAESTALFEFGS